MLFIIICMIFLVGHPYMQWPTRSLKQKTVNKYTWYTCAHTHTHFYMYVYMYTCIYKNHPFTHLYVLNAMKESRLMQMSLMICEYLARNENERISKLSHCCHQVNFCNYLKKVSSRNWTLVPGSEPQCPNHKATDGLVTLVRPDLVD